MDFWKEHKEALLGEVVHVRRPLRRRGGTPSTAP